MGDKKPGKGKKKKGDFKGAPKGHQNNPKNTGHQQHSGRGR
jgi:hypothetical protein